MIRTQQRPAGRLCLIALALGTASPGLARGADPADRAKVATSSSLASAGAAIRQRAFDGSAATAFRSADPARTGDHLTFTFDAPVPVRGVAVTTGDAAGADALDGGAVEVSEDGATFAPVATCDATGSARAEFAARPVRAVRVRAARDLGHPLVVREVEITADRVGPFRHPVEFRVVCDDAPELRPWAEDTARLCEQWYDALHAAIGADDVRSADRVTLTLSRSYKGVAQAGRDHILGAVAWFAAHPDDRGALIHETVHIIQQYPGYGTDRAPAWLVEGLDDYIRFFVYEPGKAGPVPPRQARYDASYRITASFLDYLVRTHDRDLVAKLDRALRTRQYTPAFFEQATGKPVATLNDEWRKSLGITVAADEPARPAARRDRGTPAGAIEGGEAGTPFQDRARGRLAKVTVRAGSWVDSATCTWLDARGWEDPGSVRGGTGGEPQVLTLEPGESLVQVAGIIRGDGDEAVVGSLTFKTTRRTVGPFGETTEGRKFTLDAPEGREICGLRGRAGDYLNAVGILCRPIP